MKRKKDSQRGHVGCSRTRCPLEVPPPALVRTCAARASPPRGSGSTLPPEEATRRRFSFACRNKILPSGREGCLPKTSSLRCPQGRAGRSLARMAAENPLPRGSSARASAASRPRLQAASTSAAAAAADVSAAAVVAVAPSPAPSGASTAEEAASKSTRPMLHCCSAWRSESPRSEVLSSVAATPTLARPCRARRGVRHAQREVRAIAATKVAMGMLTY